MTAEICRQAQTAAASAGAAVAINLIIARTALQIFTSNQHHDDTENLLIRCVCRYVSKAHGRQAAEREIESGNVSLALS
jgi:hypothetical protein